jgi:hypothetical protein
LQRDEEWAVEEKKEIRKRNDVELFFDKTKI